MGIEKIFHQGQDLIELFLTFIVFAGHPVGLTKGVIATGILIQSLNNLLKLLFCFTMPSQGQISLTERVKILTRGWVLFDSSRVFLQCL